MNPASLLHLIVPFCLFPTQQSPLTSCLISVAPWFVLPGPGVCLHRRTLPLHSCSTTCGGETRGKHRGEAGTDEEQHEMVEGQQKKKEKKGQQLGKKYEFYFIF